LRYYPALCLKRKRSKEKMLPVVVAEYVAEEWSHLGWLAGWLAVLLAGCFGVERFLLVFGEVSRSERGRGCVGCFDCCHAS